MSCMVRPTKYDIDKVLSSATHEFWLHGYEGTTMANLLNATGLTSRSLYNRFGSKEGMFEECLERYYQDGMKKLIDLLKKENGREAIRNFFSAITSAVPVNGCLLGNTLSEQNLVSKKSMQTVRRYLRNLEKVFAEKLRYAKDYEEFEGDPELRAKQMVIFVIGLGQISKNIAELKKLQDLANDFLNMNKI